MALINKAALFDVCDAELDYDIGTTTNSVVINNPFARACASLRDENGEQLHTWPA